MRNLSSFDSVLCLGPHNVPARWGSCLMVLQKNLLLSSFTLVAACSFLWLWDEAPVSSLAFCWGVALELFLAPRNGSLVLAHNLLHLQGQDRDVENGSQRLLLLCQKPCHGSISLGVRVQAGRGPNSFGSAPCLSYLLSRPWLRQLQMPCPDLAVPSG